MQIFIINIIVNITNFATFWNKTSKGSPVGNDYFHRVHVNISSYKTEER